MAKQIGVLEIEGTLGELCFYKTKNGSFVRRKSSISKSRIKSDPAFERTRQLNGAFARAAQAVKLLRSAFRPLMHRIGEKVVVSRLMSRMLKLVRAAGIDPENQTKLSEGELALLEGFQFNDKVPFGKLLHAPWSVSIDRAKGTMVVKIPKFSPAGSITAPEGATHFRIFSGGAEVDFESNHYNMKAAESAYLSTGEQKIGPLRLAVKINQRSQAPLFLLVGIEFFQVVNGSPYLMKNKNFNALTIAKVLNS